jgi:hypothetical protein
VGGEEGREDVEGDKAEGRGKTCHSVNGSERSKGWHKRTEPLYFFFNDEENVF